MKFNLKKSIALTACVLMALSITACGKKTEDKKEVTIEAVTETTTKPASEEESNSENNTAIEINTSQALSKEEYITEVNNLESIGNTILAQVLELKQKLDNKEFTQAEAIAEVEKIKETSKGYAEFAEISNVPEEFKEIHSQLAENSKAFYASTNKLLDTLSQAIQGKAATKEELKAIQDAYIGDLSNLLNTINQAKELAK